MAADSPVPPWALIVIGAILTVPGMMILLVVEGNTVAGVVGPLLVFVGGLATAIGAIGAGVMVGLRRVDWLRARR